MFALAYINEAFMLSSAATMAAGWVMIRRKKIETHRKLMVTSSILAALFFITYVLKTLVVGDTTFGGPSRWNSPYTYFLQTHSILATVGAILGIITLRFAFKSRFGKHKRIAPWTAIIWFITVASGLMVFLLLYVFYQPGPTTNMFQAWLGH